MKYYLLTNSIETKEIGRNDKLDAFRHVFFNSMNSIDVGLTIAKFFSDVHDSEVPSNLNLEVDMDIFNNNQGIIAGDDSNLSDQQLSDIIFQMLLDGELYYLSPLDTVVPPNYGIDSSTQLTPTNQ